MALSGEVLDAIAFSKQNGFDRLNLASPTETRKVMAKAAQDPGPTVVANVLSKTITHHSIPVRIYIPFGEGPFPLISYYHGGGFVLMGLETHDEICRQICKNTGCIVMSVVYVVNRKWTDTGEKRRDAFKRFVISDKYNFFGVEPLISA